MFGLVLPLRHIAAPALNRHLKKKNSHLQTLLRRQLNIFSPCSCTEKHFDYLSMTWCRKLFSHIHCVLFPSRGSILPCRSAVTQGEIIKRRSRATPTIASIDQNALHPAFVSPSLLLSPPTHVTHRWVITLSVSLSAQTPTFDRKQQVMLVLWGLSKGILGDGGSH